MFPSFEHWKKVAYGNLVTINLLQACLNFYFHYFKNLRKLVQGNFPEIFVILQQKAFIYLWNKLPAKDEEGVHSCQLVK